MIENNQVHSSAIVTKAGNDRRIGLEQPINGDSKQIKLTRPINMDSLWCTYYKKPRHTKEECWKLHGRPQTMNKSVLERSGQSEGSGRAFMAKQLAGENSHDSPVEFNREAIEKLKNLLDHWRKPPHQVPIFWCSQEQGMRSMIGLVKEVNGLYYIEESNKGQNL